jgi:hypothetical protein
MQAVAGKERKSKLKISMFARNSKTSAGHSIWKVLMKVETT